MSLHSQLDSHKIYEGYLYKKGVFNKAWKRRYFVLYDDRTVDYFKDKSYSTQRNKAKGTIYLTQIKRVELVKYTNNTNIASYNIHQFLASYDQHTPIFSTLPITSISNQDEITKTMIWSIPLQSELNNDDLHRNSSLFINKQIICNDIKRYHGKTCEYDLSPQSEYDIFHSILSDTKLGLKCDRRYSFALISDKRKWILSSEKINDLKDWISSFYKLCQGKPIYDGYLNDNKYFILYQHKVINCYNGNNILFDIDLRHILYLKYDKNKRIEIGISNNKKNNYVLNAFNKMIANGWYNKIQSLFTDKLLLKILYHSNVENINVIHNGQQLKNRYIVMYKHYIVIFKDEKQFISMQEITFFNKRIFINYIRKEKCILIPLNENIKIQETSTNNGKYMFFISNDDGDRKWYFNFNNKQTLKEWMCSFQNLIKTLNYNANSEDIC